MLPFFHRNFHTLFTLTLILATIATIVSCGGGGGGGGDSPPTPPTFPASVSLTSVASGFNSPVEITNAGDGSGRLFVVEQSGTVRIVRNGSVLASPFLNITGIVRSGGEQGLLGLAFPPDFVTRQHFYVNYIDRTGAVGNTVVARYRLAGTDVADRTGAVSLLSIIQPFTNHNGGKLAFGPDGHLYIASGDGGSGGDPLNNAQNPASLLGKLLRIDVLSGIPPYRIPVGNPFGNEVWAMGLRNPWKFSFDRGNGDLYIGDVGQSLFEEVNHQPAASGGGANYGWNIMEAFNCFNSITCSQAGLILPAIAYPHGNGDCSVTGGFVYRGSRYPSFQGMYLYGDFCSGRIWGARFIGGAWESRLLLDSTLQISSFGEDEAGEIYVADYLNGGIYRVDLP